MQFRFSIWIFTGGLFFLSCKRKLTAEEIQKYNWKYYSGNYYGDFISCDIWNCEVKADTLYILGTPSYIIVDAYHDGLKNHEKMLLKPFDEDSLGIYIGK